MKMYETRAHQKRIAKEKSELDAKIKKLSDFIEAGNLALIDAEEAERLRRQLEVMGELSNILGYRISNLKIKRQGIVYGKHES